jgi:hypothetical protein
MEMQIRWALLPSCSEKSSADKAPKDRELAMRYDDLSGGMKATQVVPTLDAPISIGKNVIWCASFLSAWKALQIDLAGELVSTSALRRVLITLSFATGGALSTQPFPFEFENELDQSRNKFSHTCDCRRERARV